MEEVRPPSAVEAGPLVPGPLALGAADGISYGISGGFEAGGAVSLAPQPWSRGEPGRCLACGRRIHKFLSNLDPGPYQTARVQRSAFLRIEVALREAEGLGRSGKGLSEQVVVDADFPVFRFCAAEEYRTHHHSVSVDVSSDIHWGSPRLT
jgi:hypothetical protein